jgi:hypothetical protein
MATLAQKLAERAGDYLRFTAEFSLPVTAVANTDFIFTIPANAQNVTYRTITTTGYGAATDATIAIGSAAGGAQYVAATTIKAVGVKSHTPVDAAAASHLTHPGDLYVRIAQTGAASATGAATLCVDYSLPVS